MSLYRKNLSSSLTIQSAGFFPGCKQRIFGWVGFDGEFEKEIIGGGDEEGEIGGVEPRFGLVGGEEHGHAVVDGADELVGGGGEDGEGFQRAIG